MKCAYIEKPGPASELRYGDQPTPKPGAGQVLVKIAAAAINPIDTYIRSGAIPMQVSFPYIPGSDLAGTVEAVGEGASRFQTGDRVWATNQGLFGRPGTLAEYIAVDEGWLYPVPESMSDEQAAAGALTGITAQLGLFLFARVTPGEFVFVNGGSGGVGTMVIQFAKAGGATVITTAGDRDKQQLCRDLGADLVLDYKSPSLDDDIRDFTKDHGGLDVWWETQREPTLPRTVGMMKKRGRIILMAGRQAEPQFPLGQFYVNDLSLLGFAMFNASQDEQREAADRMNDWFSQGKWKPIIGARFPLNEAAAAHQLQEDSTLGKQGRLTGKIVVIPGGE